MKPLTYNSFMNVLNFAQQYYQGMNPNHSPLYQLPGMDENIITKFKRKLKKAMTFSEILNSQETLEKLYSCYEDAQMVERAKHYATLLPKVEFKVEVYVEEEGTRAPSIHLDDMVTIEFKVIDHSIPVGEESHYMQSQTFPYLKFINWHVFILGRNQKGLTVIQDVRIVV
jgi:hypothetical protein